MNKLSVLMGALMLSCVGVNAQWVQMNQPAQIQQDASNKVPAKYGLNNYQWSEFKLSEFNSPKYGFDVDSKVKAWKDDQDYQEKMAQYGYMD